MVIKDLQDLLVLLVLKEVEVTMEAQELMDQQGPRVRLVALVYQDLLDRQDQMGLLVLGDLMVKLVPMVQQDRRVSKEIKDHWVR